MGVSVIDERASSLMAAQYARWRLRHDAWPAVCGRAHGVRAQSTA